MHNRVKACTSSLEPRRKNIALLTLSASTLFLLHGSKIHAQDPLPATATPTIAAQSAEQSASAEIGAGDLLDVQVFDTPELSSKVRVGQSGAIDLPVTGNIDVLGLTPREANSKIEKRLRDSHIMLDPHVSVFVSEYATQGVSVLGEVKNPGTYVMLGSHSLNGALSAAGGVTKDFGPTITLTHRNDPDHPETIQVGSPNYSQRQQLTGIRAGDVVVVSRADTVYVLGDVGRSGEYPMRGGKSMSVLDALALAEGLNRTAATSSAVILRKTGEGLRRIPVNLKNIAKNSTDFPLLQPEDILVIPRSGTKAFLDLALPGMTGAVAGSVAAALIVR
jgi:polysaccharide export outer membrane protein